MNGMQEKITLCQKEIDLQKLEMDQLAKEAIDLRVNIADMQKSMGLDDELFDDLDEFNKNVSLFLGVELKRRSWW